MLSFIEKQKKQKQMIHVYLEVDVTHFNKWDRKETGKIVVEYFHLNDCNACEFWGIDVNMFI